MWHSFILYIYHQTLWYFNHFDSRNNVVLLPICDHIETHAIQKDWNVSNCRDVNHSRCQIRVLGQIFCFCFRERRHRLVIEFDMKLIFIFLHIQFKFKFKFKLDDQPVNLDRNIVHWSLFWSLPNLNSNLDVNVNIRDVNFINEELNLYSTFVDRNILNDININSKYWESPDEIDPNELKQNEIIQMKVFNVNENQNETSDKQIECDIENDDNNDSLVIKQHYFENQNDWNITRFDDKWTIWKNVTQLNDKR
jgi:hypothetical protein